MGRWGVDEPASFLNDLPVAVFHRGQFNDAIGPRVTARGLAVEGHEGHVGQLAMRICIRRNSRNYLRPQEDRGAHNDDRDGCGVKATDTQTMSYFFDGMCLHGTSPFPVM
jgi:hypothetical protein